MTRDVIRGLVLLEGSFPVDHLHPGLKHLVHYGPQTASRGALDWFAMWAFERNNKRVKSMVKHAVEPLSSLANQVELDISTRLETLTKLSLQQGAEIELTVRVRGCVLTDREKDDMQMMGITSFHDVKFFKVCKILGVHFRCGEWGCRRCGSVITTMHIQGNFTILHRRYVFYGTGQDVRTCHVAINSNLSLPSLQNCGYGDIDDTCSTTPTSKCDTG